MSSRVTLTLAAAAVLSAGITDAQDSARATRRTAAVAGVVRDQLGHSIKDAALVVDGTGLRALSNDSGYFFLGGIPAGKNAFSVIHIGHAAVHFEVDLSPDTTLVLHIPMRIVQNIAGVEVRGERVSPQLARDGFYERKNKGFGSYLTPERIDTLSDRVATAAQLLRDVRGVEVRCGSGGRCTVRQKFGGCLAVVVNKSPINAQLDDVVTVNEIYAIEVYERPLLVPLEFSLPRRLSGCGVIAVWTKTYAEP